MTDVTHDLALLGDELERAAASDVVRTRRRRVRRRIAVAVGVLAVAVPGAAVATGKLVGGEEVAARLPAGTLSLAGTSPTCTVVEQDVEYHCVLARPPAPEVSDWKGTVEPTVDATKHVNGGCRSLNSAGTEWRCYIGQAAVDQRIVSAGFLGEYAPSPGRG
jgi:hypothetical protein